MLDSFINLRLLSNPVNWLIITLVLVLVSYSIYIVIGNQSALLPKLPAY